MAEIPNIWNIQAANAPTPQTFTPGQIQTPTNSLPSVQYPEKPNVLGEVLNHAAQVFEHINNEYDASQNEKIKLETTVGQHGDLELLKQSVTDPQEYETQARAIQQKWQDYARQQATTPGQQQKLNIWLPSLGMSSNTEISYNVKTKQVEQIKVGDIEKIDIIKKTIADSIDSSPQAAANREYLRSLMDEILKHSQKIGAGVGNGSMEATDKFIKESKIDADIQRVNNMALNQPEVLKALIEKTPDHGQSEFPFLNEAHLLQANNLATARIAQKERDAELLKKKATEAFDKEMMKQLTTYGPNGEAPDLTGIAVTLSRRTDIAPEDKFKWQTQLTEMIKKSDPFSHSNPAVYAAMLDKVLSTPDQVTNDQLLQLHGKGLSSADVKGLIEQRDKGPNTPLRQAQATLKQLRDNHTFLTNEDVKNVPNKNGKLDFTGFPQLQGKNDQEYMRLSQILTQRIQNGEDASTVLNELITPWASEQIRSGFLWLGTSPQRPSDENLQDKKTTSSAQRGAGVGVMGGGAGLKSGSTKPTTSLPTGIPTGSKFIGVDKNTGRNVWQSADGKHTYLQ